MEREEFDQDQKTWALREIKLVLMKKNEAERKENFHARPHDLFEMNPGGED
jgi:hypothetical protein